MADEGITVTAPTPVPVLPPTPTELRATSSGYAVVDSKHFRVVAPFDILNVGEYVIGLEEFYARINEAGDELDLNLGWPAPYLPASAEAPATE